MFLILTIFISDFSNVLLDMRDKNIIGTKGIDNKTINEILMKQGVDVLPVTVVDGKVVKMGSYPTNDEFCNLLEISSDLLKAEEKRSNTCCCKGGCC